MSKEQILDLIVANKVSIDWHNGLSISYADRSGKMRHKACDAIESGLIQAIADGHIDGCVGADVTGAA